ncbi:MAG: hypothetical protein VW230_04280 [Candidatus Poseidoniales archaeon]
MGPRIKLHTTALAMTVLFLTSFLFSASAGSVTGGSDVNPDENDVPFSILDRTAPSQDSTTWTLSIEMDDEPKQNGTTFEITTQICLNSGVCDPPVLMEPKDDTSSGIYSVSLKPPSDHSYVNWRVKAVYSDSSSDVYPYGDWYKTWSTCWYSDGEYGGIHSTGDGCDVPSALEDEEGLLPFASVVAVISVLVAASVVYSRR